MTTFFAICDLSEIIYSIPFCLNCRRRKGKRIRMLFDMATSMICCGASRKSPPSPPATIHTSVEVCQVCLRWRSLCGNQHELIMNEYVRCEWPFVCIGLCTIRPMWLFTYIPVCVHFYFALSSPSVAFRLHLTKTCIDCHVSHFLLNAENIEIIRPNKQFRCAFTFLGAFSVTVF